MRLTVSLFLAVVASAAVAEPAADGAALYAEHCARCHLSGTRPPLAPPAGAVQQRYRAAYPVREDFVGAVAAWIAAPDAEHGLMARAIEHHGVMPAMDLAPEVRERIASHLYAAHFEPPAHAAAKGGRPAGDGSGGGDCKGHGGGHGKGGGHGQGDGSGGGHGGCKGHGGGHGKGAGHGRGDGSAGGHGGCKGHGGGHGKGAGHGQGDGSGGGHGGCKGHGGGHGKGAGHGQGDGSAGGHGGCKGHGGGHGKGGGGEAAARVLPGAPAAEDMAAAQARGRALVAPFKSALMSALGAALAEGPVNAVEVCRVTAPALAKAGGNEAVKLGRASDRLRNPANAPPAWVAALLAAYLDGSRPREPAAVALDAGRHGYVEPIAIKPMCLNCHGKDIDREVVARIDALYPEDRARGYAVGDLRGVFWVEFSD